MPIPSPFHSRTSQHCISMFYKDWAGYYAVCSYDTSHESEYFAIRNACGLLDVTPLYKYEVSGPDAARFLSRVMSKSIKKLKIGQVTYLCWCDDAGKLIDDGTVSRTGEHSFRVTAADPSLSWFSRFMRGYQVTVEDITDKLAALALQGPTSRALLKDICGDAIDGLKFFHLMPARLGDATVSISRTGYTGDMGFEIWVENTDALQVYDTIWEHGHKFGLQPVGLDCLDVTRIEAGFIMNGVDYHSAHHCLIEARKSSPFEMGLGATVQLKRSPFNGQAALAQERQRGSEWALVGLVTDWPEYESICARYDLPPQICSQAWRSSVPIYNSADTQIGYATSGVWSPLLKQNLALATVKSDYASVGSRLRMEVTVEHTRHSCLATVAEMPFFNPLRKRS